MNATKLILIEGLPGAGKSTTGQQIADLLSQRGIASRFYDEGDHEESVGFFDPSSPTYQQDLFNGWEAFAARQVGSPTLAVLSAHFWQNTALYMLDMGYEPAEIAIIIQAIATRIANLQPILIYLSPTEIAPHIHWLFALRGQGWSDFIFTRSMKMPYHRRRNHHDFTGIITFFQDCHTLCEQLFASFPYRKCKIQDPRQDWADAYRAINAYLLS